MLLRSGEAHFEAELLAFEIIGIYNNEIRGPFPSEDCRWLRSEFASNLDNLIPDLDMWCSDIAGYASWGTKIIDWPEEKIFSARGAVSFNFFEQHPEYAWVERHITVENTPDLHERLALYNRLRVALLKLFDLLWRENYNSFS